jgi:uncharacterized membrane protein
VNAYCLILGSIFLPPKRHDAFKHLLTIGHALMALVVTGVGFYLADDLSEKQPWAAFLMIVAVTVFPAIIATRIGWSAGYEAGKRDGLRSMSPKPEDPPSESYYASSR